MQRFAQQIAVVTGGCSGIGRAAADRLLAEGAEVIIVDRDATRGPAVARAMGASGGRVSFVQADLTDSSQIARMAAEIGEKAGAVQVLVNSAGIYFPKPLEELTEADWEPITGINLRATLAVSLALLPLLKKQGGAIVNVLAGSALRARKGQAIYDATKAGALSLTRSCAAGFVEHGIRVNAVAPGAVVTEMFFGADPDPARKKRELEEERLDSYNLMQRRGRADEIAGAIAFLASADASFITGAVLPIDGGRAGF